MIGNRTVTQIALVLGGLSWRRLVAGEALLLLIPRLTEGTLASATIAYRARLGYLAAELQLEDGPRTGPILQRLAFWVAREGGWSRPLASMPPAEAEHFRSTLRRCDLSHRDVPPDRWAASVRAVLGAAGAPAPAEAPIEPELRLHGAGAGWRGFSFDAARRLLEIPSPLAPPAGDVVRILVDPGAARGERYAARGTVVSVRPPADAGPGAPAGFTVALEEGAQDVACVLAERCPRGDVSGDVESALSAAVAGLAARPRRVLVVDDDALARRLLSDALAERGFEALTAADGDAGLRTIVDELLALDAVVTDVHMPGLAGDALVSAVRQAGGESELVLVVMTADPTPALVERLTAAGADAVLPKAAGPEAAAAEVERALARRAGPRPADAPAAPAGPPSLATEP